LINFNFNTNKYECEKIDDLIDANVDSTTTPMGETVLAKKYYKLINSHLNFPENYLNNYDANTTIIAPPGKNIQILAVYFDLESSSSCQYDYLEIGDYGRFCGSEKFAPIISQSNKITFRFKTDERDVRPGFQISYRSVLVPNITIIGIDVFAFDYVKYIISHSDYPNTNYPDNYDRNTTIKAPVGKQILISSIDFNLELCSSCVLRLFRNWYIW
jgi:hypothetical protein